MLFLSYASFSISFSLVIVAMLMMLWNYMIYLYFPIFPLMSTELSASFTMDWVSLLFSTTVSLISSSIILYSLSYIPAKEHRRFSMILFMFILSMLILILSNNIFFVMLGWDGLGLSSYILVVYYQNFKSSESGALTILSNRVGDITIILAIGILIFLGSWDLMMSEHFPFLILFLLLIAAFSKSAQIPFSAWLPAAMAAPTPVSALVHSSTLVTAGVFLMIRTLSSPHPLILFFILTISSLTMLLAGISANWEQDLKKIIALSTLSQIAMMFFAIAIFSIDTAYFHLITHALFKSTLFLCAGAIIHSTNYQDMRCHGSSSNNSPVIMISLGITSMALMGLPFLSGFFSKDAIIENFLFNPLNMPIIFTALFSVGLTASYSLRMTNMSTKFILKSHPDKTFHLDTPMMLSISMMTPISIILGAMLMWIMMNPQTITLPFILKLSIPLFIASGMMAGGLLSFKSKKFFSMGEASISIWFMHMISCSFLTQFIFIGRTIHKLDNSWLEMISGQGAFSMLKKSSIKPDFVSSLSMLALSMFIILPSFLMFTFLSSF